MAKWVFMEDLPDISLLSMNPQIAGIIQTSEFMRSGGGSGNGFHNYLLLFKGVDVELYQDWDGAGRRAKAALDRMRDSAFVKQLREKIFTAVKDLILFSDTTKATDLSEKTDNELAALLKEYYEIHTRVMKYGFIPNLTDYSDSERNIIIEELEEYLSAKTSSKEVMQQAIAALTTPEEESWPNKEQKEFLALAADVFSDPVTVKWLKTTDDTKLAEGISSRPDLEMKLESLINNYSWLSFGFIGPATWDKKYYLSLLSSLAKQGVNPKDELKKMEQRHGTIAKEKERFVAELGIDKEHRHLFYAAEQCVFLKAYRKDALSMGWQVLDIIARECAGRLGINIDQAHFLTLGELADALEGKSKPSLRLIERRRLRCIYLMLEGKLSVVDDENEIDSLVATLPEKVEEVSVSEITGDCACPGKSRGIVKIINKVEDIPKIKEGDILVSHATYPDLVVAMKMASAIVTDMGGLTCHAAIVSRELGIPCVVGTKFATKALKDGDEVEVDATNGIIRKISG
jgi:phosphohistidine swiveling domain-containing protein